MRTSRALAAAAATLAMIVTSIQPAMAATSTLENNVLRLGFENSLSDSSGAGHDATVRTGGAAGYTAGIVGSQAFQFNGSTALELGTSTDLQPQDLTFSFWWKPTGTMAGEQVFAWNKAAYNSDGWYLASESASKPLSLSIGAATSQPYKVDVVSPRATFFPADQWTHVVVTYDSATKAVTFYRNGLRVESTVAYPVSASANGVLGTTDGIKSLGYNGPQYKGSFLNGALDEVALWDDVATTTEVVDEYVLGAPTFDRASVAQADVDALSIPGQSIVSFTVPGTGASGSTIAWSSNGPAVEIDGTTARITRPAVGEPDAVVTLTASATYAGSVPVTKTFTVAIPALTSDTNAGGLLQQSGMDAVEIVDPYLTNAAKKEIAYLLSFDTDRLLYEFQRTSGLPTVAAGNYGGWEAGPTKNGFANATNPSRFTGHFIGHYMSAVSQAYMSTTATPEQKAQLLEKLSAMVLGINDAQTAYATANPTNAGFLPAFAVDALPSGKNGLIVPFYNLHKVEAGLLDAYKYAPADFTYQGRNVSEVALATASGFGTFIVGWQARSGLTKTQILATEYGGMNEVLFELYDYTGDPVHKQAADLFTETSLVNSLALGNDVLNGKHANTTIPKLTGVLKRYVVLNEERDSLSQAEKDELDKELLAAQNFWQIVVDDHTYANGGNSQSEHFHAPDSLWHDATQNGTGNGGYNNNSTSETCNEHNMLKLTRLLFQVTKDVKYSEYYEQAFINAILASQNPETGMTTYFQPMQAGYTKVFGTPGTQIFGDEIGEFWCCQGTGVENFAKLNDSFYFTDDDDVYVNMFWSSVFRYRANNLRLTQTADVPKKDTVTYQVEALDGGTVKSGTRLKLRVPEWVDGAVTLTKNGTALPVAPVDGWVTVPVADGDVLSYVLPAKLQLVESPDNPNWVAVKYGPILLAAKLNQKDVDKYYYGGILVRVSGRDSGAELKSQVLLLGDQSDPDEWKSNLETNVVRTDSPTDGESLRFSLNDSATGVENLELVPYYSLYNWRYATYLTLAGVGSEAYQQQLVNEKENLRESLRTVDSLRSFDNNNSEIEKNYTFSPDSTVGNVDGRTFRTAGADGWFTYDLIVDKSAATNHLAVTYSADDAGNTFQVRAGDQVLATPVLGSGAAGTYSTSYYALPQAVVDAAPQKVVGGTPVTDDEGDPVHAVTVRFQGTGTTPVGRVFGVGVVTKTEFSSDALLTSLTASAGTFDVPFWPTIQRYTLTVPADATSVDLRVVPARLSNAGGHGDCDATCQASGEQTAAFVRIDGAVVDEALAHTVALTSGVTTVPVVSYAEDHTTFQDYEVVIVKEGSTIPSATPAVHYTFDADPAVGAGAVIADTGTKGVAAAVVNGGATLVDGRDGGKALALPGGSATSSAPYVRIPTGVIAAGQKDLTVTVRARWNGGSDYQRFFDLGQSSSKYLFMSPSGGGSAFAELQSGPRSTVRAAGKLDNAWHDIAVVLQGGKQLAYYEDGRLVGTSATTLTAADVIGTSQSGYLGKSFYSDPYLNGAIDDFAVYSSALSPLQVAGYAPTLATDVSIEGPRRVTVGSTATLTADVLPAAATVKDVRWTSSDTRKATVSVAGVVTGVAPGTVTITATTVDGSAKVATVELSVVEPDVTVPTVTLTASPESPDGAAGWYVTAPVVTATGTDDRALAATEISVDGGAWTTGEGTATATLTDGRHVVQARASDESGNVSALVSLAVLVDTVGPLSSAKVDTAKRTVTVSASDATSGIARVEYRTSSTSTWRAYSAPVKVGSSATTFQYRAVDVAGHVGATRTVVVPAAPKASTTTATVASSTRYGTGAKVTIKVTGTGGTPTGTVRLTEGTKLLGSGTLSGGKVTITLSKALSVGTHRLTATYSGDRAFTASSRAVSVKIVKATSRTTMSISPSSPTSAQRATVTARVTTVKPSGTVTVTVTHRVAGKTKTVVTKKVSVSSTGLAKVQLPKLAPGTYTVKVMYGGSATATSSSVTKTLTVRR